MTMTSVYDASSQDLVPNLSSVDECNNSTKGLSHDIDRSIIDDQSNKLSYVTQPGPLIWDFSFHGKFFSRGAEKSQIMDSYRRIRSVPNSNEHSSLPEFILVTGETGVGKTALARSIRSTILKDGGYFISGKFEQTQRPEPYAAFVAALTEFSKSAISRGPMEVACVRSNIDKLIKTEHRVLTEMAPALKNIFKPIVDPTSEEVNSIGPDAANRFKYVCRMFMRAISSKEKPIIFLLDDLHWADESSLDLLYTLLSDTITCEGVLFIATYRIDEPSERLRKFLDNVDDGSIRLSVVNLLNFSLYDINEMLSEHLKMEPESVKPLTDRIYLQTKGNIFFVLECLRSLYTQNILVFDNSAKVWKWSIDDGNFVCSDSLQDLIMSMIHSISEPTRNFLIFAACLGTRLDENILRHLVSGSVLLHLQLVAANGWIKFDDIDECFKFSHDGIKEATYKMIPADGRNAFHYRIGRKLWLELSLEEIDKYIFIVVSQLLFGIDLITKQQERTAIAKLCLRAGERCVELSHFQNAFEYLSVGISLLDTRCWRDEYKFCLTLYDATAEVAFCTGNYNSVYDLVEETLKNARDFNDTIQAHCTKLNALGSNGQLKDAVSYGLEILRKLDEPIPVRYKIVKLALLTRKLKKKTKGLSDKDILQLPLMQNQSKLAVMKIMNTIFLYVLLVDPMLIPFFGLRMVRLSLEYGLNAMSSVGFILYGSFLARYENRDVSFVSVATQFVLFECLPRIWNVDEGFRFGRLGLQIFERFNILQWTGRVYAGFYGLLNHLKLPLRDSIEPLKYAYVVSLEKGDVEYACLCGNISLWLQIEIEPLEKLFNEVQAHIKQMTLLGQLHNLQMLKGIYLTVRNFLWLVNVDGEEFIDENEYNEIQSPSDSVLGWSHINRLWLYYMFGHSEKAFFHAQAAMATGLLTGDVHVHFVLLLVGLSDIENARHKGIRRLKYARKCIKLLAKYADHAPCNYLGRMYLLKAELASLEKNHVKALKSFTCAIAISNDSGFIFESAIAYERAAREFVRIGEVDRANVFFDDAITMYRKWGSIPKVTHLLEEVKSYQCRKTHGS